MSLAPAITIPYGFTPRPYQVGIYNALANGYKRAVSVWHRRAGKDKTYINIMAREAFKRIGSYYYLFPEFAQGKKIIWEGTDKNGFKFLDHFPSQLVKRRNNQEMVLELINGSIFRVIGTDNFDSKMGTNPIGCVFSEYSLQNPEVWDYFRPILLENDGWAIFNYTSRGHNHGYDLFRMAMANPDWFCERLAACAHPVFNPGGEIPYTGVLTPAQIDAELAAGMSEAKARQEFFCDFDISGDDILIALTLIEASFNREIGYHSMPKIMGVDVGMSLGGDSSAICVRQGGVVTHLEEFRFDDTQQIAGKVKTVFDNLGCDMGYIDCLSWGAGVFHTLRGWGLPFAGINVGEAAPESDRFNRYRDEIWWRGMEFFAEKQCAILPSVTNRGKLAVELSSPTYKTLPNGKIKVEGKQELKDRGVPSPNLADAFLLTLCDNSVRRSTPAAAARRYEPKQRRVAW